MISNPSWGMSVSTLCATRVGYLTAHSGSRLYRLSSMIDEFEKRWRVLKWYRSIIPGFAWGNWVKPSRNRHMIARCHGLESSRALQNTSLEGHFWTDLSCLFYMGVGISRSPTKEFYKLSLHFLEPGHTGSLEPHWSVVLNKKCQIIVSSGHR
jgi:hypothetical protein